MLAQQKHIFKLYLNNYNIVKKNVSGLGLSQSENKLSLSDKAKLKTLSKNIDRTCSKISNSVEDPLLEEMIDLCDQVIQEFEEETGIEIENKDEIVADVVKAVATGKIYNTDWNLTDAVNRSAHELDNTIAEIIAMGIDGKKSESEIVADILKAVDPDNPSHTVTIDHKTLYVGKPYSGLERIVRTTLQHSYQTVISAIVAEVSSQTDSKILIRWVSALAPNTCELCESRHNNLYTFDDLPLDHPNGQCEFYIEIS